MRTTRNNPMGSITLHQRFLSDYTSVGTRVPNADFEVDCLIWNHHVTKARANNEYRGYGIIKVDGRNAQVHRFAYHQLVDESFPIWWTKEQPLHIDHLCRVTNCFEPSHLTPRTNRGNIVRGTRSMLNPDKTSKHVGVSWDKENKNWRAGIYINGRAYNLGGFANEEDAAEAYQQALRTMNETH